MALRLARRELRGGLAGFRVLIACLALGVAAIAGVGAMNAAISEGLRADARKLLGGDLSARLIQRSIDAEHRAAFDAAGTRSDVIEMRSMVRRADGQGRRSLIELKGVDDRYPLVDRVTLESGGGLDQALAQKDGRWGAVVDNNLMIRLDLKRGDLVKVGAGQFEIRDVIKREPDRVASVFSFGPRLMVRLKALDDTGLIVPGSQIRYIHRLLLPPGGDGTLVKASLEERFPDAGWDLRTTDRAAPGISRFIERMTLFLSFAGLTALLVGGIGVTNAVKAYMDGRTETVATLKCLGAPARLIFRIYMLQVLALSSVAIIIGLALGAAVPTVAAVALNDSLPVRIVPGVYGLELAAAALFGLLTAVTFAVWPLARARGLPGGALFRETIAPAEGRIPWRDKMIVALGGLALAAMTVATAPRRDFALWFVVGAALTLLLLRGAAWVIAAAARRTHPSRPAWRQAMANLHRPGAPTASVVVSLGLGLTVLVAVGLIEGNLRHQIEQRLPERAPSFFFIDIQPDQVDPFDALIAGHAGASDLQRVPSVRGRITHIDGVPVDQVDVAQESQWAIRGDRALTYAAAPSPDAKIIDGQWWEADYRGDPLISLDAGLARGFGVGIGDTLTLNVLGRRLTGTIASLRRINWRTLRFDFALILSPGILEEAPHAHIAAAHVSQDREESLERAVADTFPNISAIRVREALDAVSGILAGISQAVRAIASVTLVAGMLVLAGAIAAGRTRRLQDAVVFKVLGATRGMILRIFLLEYGLLGLATGAVAVALGSTVAWAVIVHLMNAEWVFLPAVAALTAVLCLAATIGLGFVGTWRVLGEKAAPHLRNE
ncbi:ABC transporter permease [Magnetospira sp. QH-2]|uniref:ABC transporter permease n=1 Tax=Magnetospira sp. (strain QH-2) TaxID=1288970 RepID=UPI00208FEB54|nr:FtsX-like permease family protein [Magnetospira sp. QH-2]